MIKEAIIKAANRENLSYETAEAVMDEIMGGKASEIQMAAFLTAMAVKGETIDEITASAAGMRKHCIRILHDMDVLEIVGTGGDKSNSFNISTTSALVISAAGIPVAKHGNRAASSKSGAADVLEALGVDITVPPERSLHLLKTIGLCFLFAQNYHLSMKYVAPVRKELGIRTIFNILGPLVNPAGANMELLGVYDEELTEPMARVLANLGVKNALVVYGQDGLDEISMSAPTSVCEVRNGEFKSYVIEPEQFGFKRCKKEDLVGGTPAENAVITRAILSGTPGPKQDAVLLNSAAAIHIARPEVSITDAIVIAKEVIDSGKALKQLDQFIALSIGGVPVFFWRRKYRQGTDMILDEIAAHTRLRVDATKAARSFEQVREAALTAVAPTVPALQASAAGQESSVRSASVPARGTALQGAPHLPAKPVFERALSIPGLSFICEVKKASPSKGLIAGDFPYLEIARDYETAGAAAVSVLTEPEYFLGSDEYLREIAAAVQVPVLRKDFVIDPYQIYEAKLLGASAVLLICALLDTKTLGDYIALADTLGLSALVETHAEDEIRSALDAGARIIGINNRDLKTFRVDLAVTGRLCKLIPRGILTVSESGIRGPEDIRTLTREQQIDAVLIGETLMRAADKKGYLRELRDAAAGDKPVSKDRQ